MDPKQQLSQLDPKLREAYERVMSSSASTAPNPAAPGQPPQMQPTPSMTPSPINADGGAKPVTPTINPSPTPTMGGTTSESLGTSTSPFTTPSSPSATMAPAAPGTNPTPSPVGQTAAPTIPVPNVNPSPMPNVTTSPIPTTPGTDPKTTGPIKVQFNGQVGPQAGVTAQQAAGKQKGKGISPVLMISAIAVFVVAWLIFWMKIFNFPIPFIGS